MRLVPIAPTVIKNMGGGGFGSWNLTCGMEPPAIKVGALRCAQHLCMPGNQRAVGPRKSLLRAYDDEGARAYDFGWVSSGRSKRTFAPCHRTCWLSTLLF